jgi:hypothetical protein
VLALCTTASYVTPADACGMFAESDSRAVVARSDVQRTMHHADAVIHHALRVLGQPINPIRVIGAEEIAEIYSTGGIEDPPPGLLAFRSPGDATDPTIYVNRASEVYLRATRKASPLNVLKLAATLAHEQVHNTDGEMAAYRLQADFVRGRIEDVSWREKEDASRYLAELDARARVSITSSHTRGSLPRTR